MGQRDRTAEDRQASPFALLVDDADAPAPPAKNRGKAAAASRTSAAETPSSPADTTTAAPATLSTNVPAASPPKQDDGAADPAAVPVDAAVVATIGETLPKIDTPKVATPDSEQDPKTTDVDTKTDTDAAEVATATPSDAGSTQTTGQTSQPMPDATSSAPAALTPPVVLVVAIPIQATPAAPAGHDADDIATGPVKAAPTPAPTLPAGAPQPTDVPVAGPQQPGVPKKDKAATAAGANTEPPANSEAPTDDGQDDGQDAKVDGRGTTPAPTQPTPSNGTRSADPHIRPRDRDESQKLDDLLSQPFAAPANAAAHAAKPPTEAMHAVLQAADGLAGAATAANPGAAPPSQATLDPAVPIAGLAVEIATRAQAGRSRFEIRLDPPELGRIDVRLDVDNSGQVTSRLVVDRPETLEHLRRDASELERALQQAGLKTADNGLQFSLRDQSGGFAGRDNGRAFAAPARLIVHDANAAPIDALQASYGRTVRVGGLDISV